MLINWTIDPGLLAREGTVIIDGASTWFAEVGGQRGRPGSDAAPLLLIHGGPGLAHDYLEPLAALAQTGRRVIFYDQQGCGNSARADAPNRWTIDFFVRELSAIRGALGLKECHMLGHGWGGMLLMEYLTRRPFGVRSAVLASAPSSMDHWGREVERLRASLVLASSDEVGVLDGSEPWQRGDESVSEEIFNEQHFCRVAPQPECLARSLAKGHRNPQVYRANNGPHELHMINALRGWEIRSRLQGMHVPILLTSGIHDVATPSQMRALSQCLPASHWVMFTESSHTPHLEEPAAYSAIVADFLSRHDDRQGAWPNRPAANASSDTCLR